MSEFAGCSEEDFAEWMSHLYDNERIVYRGQALRAVTMPLGGIGAGQIALCGDGSLQQWEIFNVPHHQAQIPHSFFAIRAQSGEETTAAVLQTDMLYEDDFEPVPSVSDWVVPETCKELLGELPGVAETEFVGEYPFAEVKYIDEELPVEVSLKAFSPMVPLEVKSSSLPGIVFSFHASNSGDQAVEVAVMASLQNAVGYDGSAEVSGTTCHCYGGNYNTPVELAGMTAVNMENARLPADSAGNGSMALAALGQSGTVKSSWDDLQALWAEFAEKGELTDNFIEEPSADGNTYNAAVCQTVTLQPGEEVELVFVYSWYFPNHYVNWDQTGFGVSDEKSKFWLGNMYNNWFESALEVAQYVQDNYAKLAGQTELFRRTFYDSTLPYWLLDCISANAAELRSPTVMFNEDGNLHGFEGCCGASATHCSVQGCCPLNCTHVWNYEMTLSKLYPSLERTMRQTDLLAQQREDGGIIFRTVLPLYLPRWPEKDPDRPTVACDGHWGTILKTYREYRQSGDEEFLEELWPSVKRAFEYGFATWDENGDGMLEGRQWNTYDLNYWGKTTYTTGLYLAALRAGEKMAEVTGDVELAADCRQRYEKGYQVVDDELFDGEYYIQDVDEEAHPEMQYGKGCLTDQLFGQWWAHALDLGHILPKEHVASALMAIYRYNFRHDFVGFKQQPRTFASPEDKGVLICSWPHGGRAEKPMLYCDETWSSLAYQVAGGMIYEGIIEPALVLVKAAREVYDGTRRSPWNEVECGDHYVRPMSSWLLLEAAQGYRYDAAEQSLGFGPKMTPEDFRSFFITASGWGTFSQTVSDGQQQVTLSLKWGELALARLELDLAEGITANDIKVSVPASTEQIDGRLIISFAEVANLKPDDQIEVTIR